MKSILIVEDSPSINLFYKKLFEGDGSWDIHTYYTFEEALGALEDRSFDYIISDGYVESSKMTGIDFLKITKMKLPQTVRLYVSGTIMPEQADYENFNAFINKKDLKGEELLSLINCISVDDDSEVPVSFFTNVFLS